MGRCSVGVSGGEAGVWQGIRMAYSVSPVESNVKRTCVFKNTDKNSNSFKFTMIVFKNLVSILREANP